MLSKHSDIIFIKHTQTIAIPIFFFFKAFKLGSGSGLVNKSYPTLFQPHRLYVARQAPLSMGFPRQEYWSE